MGAKVFPLALEAKGIVLLKMSEVLAKMEQEDLINLETWLRLRELRNNLEHEYPNELDQALLDLAEALRQGSVLEGIVEKIRKFLG